MHPLSHLIRTMAPIDEAVLQLAQNRLAQPDTLAALTPNVNTAPLIDEHAPLSERKSTLTGMVADGSMSAADVWDAVERLNARLAEIDRTLSTAGQRIALLTEEEQKVGLAALNLDRQRALIDGVMTVHLYRAPRGRKGFNPATVGIIWNS